MQTAQKAFQLSERRIYRALGQPRSTQRYQKYQTGEELNDGSCLRLKPQFPNHVWSYDFMFERTHAGRAFRILTVIDEFTRKVWQCEWNVIWVMRRRRSA